MVTIRSLAKASRMACMESFRPRAVAFQTVRPPNVTAAPNIFSLFENFRSFMLPPEIPRISRSCIRKPESLPGKKPTARGPVNNKDPQLDHAMNFEMGSRVRSDLVINCFIIDKWLDNTYESMYH